MSSEEIIRPDISSERRDSDFFYQSTENIDDFDAGEHYSDSINNCNKVFDFNPHKSILIDQKGNTRRDWYSHDVVLQNKESKFFEEKFGNDEFDDIDFINDVKPRNNQHKHINKFSSIFTGKGDTKLENSMAFGKSL